VLVSFLLLFRLKSAISISYSHTDMGIIPFIICAALLAGPRAKSAEPLSIAAAADLQWVLKDATARFEAATGVPVTLSFGSSGNFYSQIENGAPYDLFFSADVGYAKRLETDESKNLAEPGSLYQYATGKIVLWVPNDSGVDVSKGLEALRNPAIKKIAIANPAHAPYGRAAETALKKSGLWELVSARIVQGENISQTAQLVQSGNADAGILALSLVLAPAMKNQGRYFVIPAELYPPLQQACVILKASPHKSEAKQFLDFIKTKEIRRLFEQYGFSVAGDVSS
jgi:molybdate transport system substrate-binding protein